MHLDESYRSAEQLSPELLREHNKNLYWNLVWHFADGHLPYDFMVPYAGDEELWDEFIHTNDHLHVRNKTRLDQIIKNQEGGSIENYIKYVE